MKAPHIQDICSLYKKEAYVVNLKSELSCTVQKVRYQVKVLQHSCEASPIIYFKQAKAQKLYIGIGGGN
jgi:hypothetical protein